MKVKAVLLIAYGYQQIANLKSSVKGFDGVLYLVQNAFSLCIASFATFAISSIQRVSF